MSADSQDVDLIVNVYERTYPQVLQHGFFSDLERQNQRHFRRRIVLVNNVLDPAHVKRCAQPLLARQEIDALIWVDDHIAAARTQTAWPNDPRVGSVRHYSDWALVALTLHGSRWLLCWDAEASLSGEVDWVGAGLRFLERHPDVLLANPDWGNATSERHERVEGFALGYGFSDQVFLVDRARLAAPIYHYFCPASWRYPLAHVELVFEARVDAYMRRSRLRRATFLGARYRHTEGTGDYPRPKGVRQRLRRWRNRWMLKLLRRELLPGPCWRI